MPQTLEDEQPDGSTDESQNPKDLWAVITCEEIQERSVTITIIVVIVE